MISEPTTYLTILSETITTRFGLHETYDGATRALERQLNLTSEQYRVLHENAVLHRYVGEKMVTLTIAPCSRSPRSTLEEIFLTTVLHP